MAIASRKRWTEAVSLGKKIVHARETQLGENHIATLVSVANLLEILKYAPAPADILPVSEHTQLRNRISEATAQGLFEWTAQGGGEPLSRAQSHKGAANNGQRRLARQKFIRSFGSIFQQPLMDSVRTQMIMLQSQQQQQQ